MLFVRFLLPNQNERNRSTRNFDKNKNMNYFGNIKFPIECINVIEINNIQNNNTYLD